MPIFGRKKQNKQVFTIELLPKSGGEPLRGRISILPLSEEKIVEYSIKFFDDPTPCIIHKSAVQERLFAEWEAALKAISPEGSVLLSELPVHLTDMLCEPGNYSEIKWYEIVG